MCAVAAAVQGMDETVINGAQLFFATQFGIDTLSGPNTGQHQWILGLVNSAPYVCLLRLYNLVALLIIYVPAMRRASGVLAHRPFK